MTAHFRRVIMTTEEDHPVQSMADEWLIHLPLIFIDGAVCPVVAKVELKDNTEECVDL